MASALSPETWHFSLELLPQPIYLVGGAVRDAILNRQSDYLDLDFVLSANAVQVARQLAKLYQAGFVLLDAQRQIARVVFPDATVDFAQQVGASLESDLRRRDFTINAIAYNPHTREFIDPLAGCADLQQRLIRMIAPANLQDDPLRLLRGYRQAAQLGFTIDSDTQTTIRTLAPLLSQIAAERVRVELGYLLNSAEGSHWIGKAVKDGLLTAWFNSATLEKSAQLAAIDAAAVSLTQTWSALGKELCQRVREPLKTTWLGVAKLTCLVAWQPELAEVELMKLTYSRSEIKSVITALKLLPQLQLGQMSLAEQYFFFRAAGSVFSAIAVLAVANHTPKNAIAPLIERYLTPDDPVAHPLPLISGKDLMQALQLSPGQQIGELLTAIQLAHIEGKVSTPAQAVEFARSYI